MKVVFRIAIIRKFHKTKDCIWRYNYIQPIPFRYTFC